MSKKYRKTTVLPPQTSNESWELPLGERIKDIRLHLRLSQKDFADKINISGSFLSEVEAGKSKLGYEFLNKIALTFQVNPSYLLIGKGRMFINPGSGENLAVFNGEFANPTDGSDEFGDIVNEMLWYFRRSSLVKMAVLEFFKRYIFKNRQLIREDIEKKAAAGPLPNFPHADTSQ